MEATVAMLGKTYGYGYAPTPGQGVGASLSLFGEDADTTAAERLTSQLIDTIKTSGADIVRAYKNDPTRTADERAAADAALQRAGTWFDRNQTLVVAGAVVLVVGVVAIGTTKKRRGRR